LKKYWIQYKPFLVFLFKFLLVYLVLSLTYQYYLSLFSSDYKSPDDFTVLVSNQSAKLLNILNFDAFLSFEFDEPFARMSIDGKYVARVVEGCNAMSVMILFVSFVIAFKGRFFKTLIFSSIGVLIIHLLNILRIALLVIGLRYYPEYKELMHDIIFPLFIYGVVFLLWVVWVNKFSDHATVS
jgi:exosortase family protein XrtF